VIVLGDPPDAWERLGFEVRDGIVALEGEQLHLTGRGGGILEVTAPELTSDEPDGLILKQGSDPYLRVVRHPNGASVVDHVVVLTGSLERTVGALVEAGLDLRREVPGIAFLRLGSYILEVVERGGDPAHSGGSWWWCPTPARWRAPGRSRTPFSRGGASRPWAGSGPSSRSCRAACRATPAARPSGSRPCAA
jgi:hypothetical protein